MKVMPLGRQDAFPREFGGAGFLIQEGEQLFLIDCPPGINLMLHQAGFTPMDLTAIFITHLHNDHVGGLVELTQFRTLGIHNKEIWMNAGYFEKIAQEKIDIFILGNDEKWLELLDQLITLNNPRPWKEFHKVVVLEDPKFSVGGIEVETMAGVHEPNSCGVKFDHRVSFSGDTMYDDDFEDWLFHETQLIFHEAGYGGAHCHPEDLPKIIERTNHDQTLFFNHLPFPVIPWMEQMRYPMVEKIWYEV